SSAATPVIETVHQAATSTAISGSLSSSVYGQPVTFTATVTSQFAVPNGSVVFVVDNVNQPPTGLDGAGKATLTLSTLPPGPHTVAVSYAGNANFGGSSPAGPATLTVAQAGTATALSSSANPAPVGQPVTFTATVTSPFATPDGTVTFVVDNVTQPA